jgi:hypothetical protein
MYNDGNGHVLPYSIGTIVYGYGKAGGRYVLFSSELSKGLIVDFVKDQGLIGTQSNIAAGPMVAERSTSQRQNSNTYNEENGCDIKAPHIHYDGKTYFLTDKQWNAFSQKVIKGFQNKLAHAKGVNFDQLMKLSDVMSEIVSDE